jgi:hypothetical protein
VPLMLNGGFLSCPIIVIESSMAERKNNLVFVFIIAGGLFINVDEKSFFPFN